MIIKYSQVVHSPVLEISGQSNLGIVYDLVIQKSDFSIKAVLLKTGSFKLLTKTATYADIIELNSGSVIVKNNDSIVDLSEAQRIREAIKDKMYGINQRVRTKSGKYLGKVYDYTIENTTGCIQKFFVKSLLEDRLISVGSIIKIEGKNITVKDDFELITCAGPAFKSETA